MKLTIFNLNAWLLPLFSISNTKRLAKIITLIRKISPDIIILQEVWLRPYVIELQKMLPGYTFTPGHTTFFNQGGLVTGTKVRMPVINHKFVPVKEYSLIEKWGNKGYQVIQLPEQKLFVNTHLYSPTKESEKQITTAQFQLLSTIVEKTGGILAGDFNTKESEFVKMNTVFQYRLTNTFTVSLANSYTTALFNSAKEDTKFDYIVGAHDVHVTEEILPEIVSDHYAMIGTVLY